MSFDVSPTGGIDAAVTSTRARAAAAAFSSHVEAARADLGTTAAPPVLPPEVLREVDAASRRFDELEAQGRRLHFEPDAETGCIRVEVRDLDGRVLREIALSEALEVPSGRRV